MSGQNRLPVVPTVTVLGQMKTRLAGAVKGHALLKKKADALTIRFRQVKVSPRPLKARHFHWKGADRRRKQPRWAPTWAGESPRDLRVPGRLKPKRSLYPLRNAD